MSKKLEYMVVIEKGSTSYGAYVPDLPGCVAVAETREEALELLKESIELHLEDLRERGEDIPVPCSSGELIEIQAA
jgi:predicted RNase H-like HicB family nuclease